MSLGDLDNQLITKTNGINVTRLTRKFMPYPRKPKNRNPCHLHCLKSQWRQERPFERHPKFETKISQFRTINFWSITETQLYAGLSNFERERYHSSQNPTIGQLRKRSHQYHKIDQKIRNKKVPLPNWKINQKIHARSNKLTTTSKGLLNSIQHFKQKCLESCHIQEIRETRTQIEEQGSMHQWTHLKTTRAFSLMSAWAFATAIALAFCPIVPVGCKSNVQLALQHNRVQPHEQSNHKDSLYNHGREQNGCREANW